MSKYSGSILIANQINTELYEIKNNYRIFELLTWSSSKDPPPPPTRVAAAAAIPRMRFEVLLCC